MLSPVTVGLKVGMQRLWDTKIEWDTEMSPENAEEWEERFRDVTRSFQTDIPRYTGAGGSDSVLHGFSDASDQAYGAVFWLVQGGKARFVAAKTMVAPLKVNTIPRLELLGMQLAARMAKSIRGAIGEVRTIIWTDSQTAHHWVKAGAKKFKAFVSARIQEIHENLPDADAVFKLIPTEHNAADDLTKCNVDPDELSQWLVGPSFLTQEERLWPERVGPTAINDVEAKKKEKSAAGKRRTRRKKAKMTQETRLKVFALKAGEDSEKITSWTELLHETTEREKLESPKDAELYLL